MADLLKASGCVIEQHPKNLILNFDTGRHAMVLQFDQIDPRRIKLMLAFARADGDVVRARWACFEATAKQFASKATVDEWGTGFIVEFSVGVYAEALHAFGDSIKAYVEDVEKLYEDWVELMVLDD